MTPVPADPLKLIVLDEEDLAIVSAHLQEAIIRVEDIAWLPGERRFAMMLRRFDWECEENPRRRLAAMHFESVERVQRADFPGTPDAVLDLLAITFEPTEAPSGTVTLHFAGGPAIRLHVECLEAQMKDLGPVWEAATRPCHDDVMPDQQTGDMA